MTDDVSNGDDGEMLHREIAEKVARVSLFQVRVSPCYRRQQTMQYEEVDYLHGFKGEITLARNVVKSFLVLNLISLVVSIVLPAKIKLVFGVISRRQQKDDAYTPLYFYCYFAALAGTPRTVPRSRFRLRIVGRNTRRIHNIHYRFNILDIVWCRIIFIQFLLCVLIFIVCHCRHCQVVLDCHYHSCLFPLKVDFLVERVVWKRPCH